MGVPVSIMIPTKNEEQNIGKCLGSVAWADEIYVIDSSSTDRTAEIAAAMGAKVINFHWDGKGPRKKNWALENLPWKHEWVMVVDADEEPTAALRKEISALISSSSTHAGFRVPYRYYFLGRLLQHGEPIWKLILFKHRVTRFETTNVPEVTGYDVEIHEQPLVQGTVAHLRSHMLHHDFHDMHRYIERHNIYSDWEALLRTRYRHRSLEGEIQPRMFGSALERRRFMKRLFLSIPGKPFLHFFYSYILKAGFLDGRQGFAFSAFKAIQWYHISLKEYEIRMHDNAVGRSELSI
jgi:glycosyltransferase involved in cell wall biosynthesis